MPEKTRNGTASKSSRSQTPDNTYSDSFDSDSPDSPITPARKRVAPMHRTKAGPGGGAKGRISPRQLDATARRMISARGRKIKELLSHIEELERQLAGALVESKTLRRQTFRQEKALDKIDHSQAELPSLIDRHAEEVRSFREQIRRYREKFHAEHRAKKDTDAEVANLKRQLVRLKELTEDRHLPERDVLNRRLAAMEDDVAAKDRTVQDLTRRDEILTKNHRAELYNEIGKQKNLQRKIEELEERLAASDNSLKEKEKLLEIQNIYSQRVIRPPHRIDSSASSSATTTFHFATATRTGGGAGETEATPREKARQFEEKRRGEHKRRLEEKREKQKRLELASSDQTNGIPEENEETAQSSPRSEHVREIKTRKMRRKKDTVLHEEAEEEEHQRIARETEDRNHQEEKKRDNELMNKMLKKQEEDKLREELLRKQDEENREQKRLEAERLAEERRLAKVEEDKRRQLEEARRKKDEDDRKRREEVEEQERRRKEEEEQERQREQYELETAEERRKKDDLLSKLHQMENGKVDSSGEGTPSGISPTKKQYNFTDSVENLYRGKPSSEATLPAYMEQRRRSQNQQDKKLMEELFGSSAKPPAAKKEGITPPSDSESSSVRQSKRTSSQLPWETEDESSKLLPKRISQPKTKVVRPAVSAVDEVDDIEELIL